MKNRLAILLVLALTSFLVWGCAEDPVYAPNDTQAGPSGTIQLSHTESEPFVTDLLAGQTIDVGDVKVWNDGTDLHVTYTINPTESGWCLTETHLHVAYSLEEIPQNNGNPIPGQFDYKHEDLNCVTMDSYTIPLTEINPSWDCNDDLYIAAHAVVVRPIEDCWETVWQIGDVEVINDGTGWLENYADEFNWGDPADPITLGPSLVVVKPPFTDPFIVGSTPTNQFPYNSNYTNPYATDFDVQWSGELPYGGKLKLSWSPGQSATEKKVISDGFSTQTFTALGQPISGQGWFLDTYPLVENTITVEPLPDGDHTIRFQHTQGDGTFWDWIRLERPCVQEETAWGAGADFPGKNWATYFMYTIQCDGGGGNGDCDEETAWGGATAGGGPAWWFYFDTQGPETQPIYAGQNSTDGNVTWNSATDELTINLGSWSLKNVSEPLKIQGYDEIPSSRPSAGLFTTYKGDDLVVTGDGSRYYAIHLDVEQCN